MLFDRDRKLGHVFLINFSLPLIVLLSCYGFGNYCCSLMVRAQHL